MRARAAPRRRRGEGRARACISTARARRRAALYERDRLPPGARLAGPAIVEQFDATTVVPPGWTRAVDGFAQPHPGAEAQWLDRLRCGRARSRRQAERAIDPVTVQIIRNKVASLVDEMHYHFYRSGYSTIIRESRDFTCVILDRDGRLITPPPMFFHAPVYRHFVGRILELYPPATMLRDGDVFVSNHPYEAGMPHVSDMGFVAPIFADGKLVGFSGSIAHKADVGGTDPGSTSANATEMFHEGLLLPPVKICARRRYDAGHRAPHPRQQPPARAGARRHPRADRRDRDGRRAHRGAGRALRRRAWSTGAFAAILAGTGRRARAPRSARCPTAPPRPRAIMDDDGVELDKPVKLAVTITVDKGGIAFDFSQSDPQAKGPVNLRPVDGRGLRVLFADRRLGPELQLQRRHARRGAAALRAAHRDQRRRRRRRSRATRWPTSSWST